MREATATRFAAFIQVMQGRSYMKWAYPLWNEVLCIILPVEIINTWLYVAWRDLAPHNGVPPLPPQSHSILYEFSKLTCCKLGYLHSISSKFIDSLGKHPQKVRQPWCRFFSYEIVRHVNLSFNLSVNP